MTSHGDEPSTIPDVHAVEAVPGPIEVWADAEGIHLLVFDGRVLELFGYADAHRLHLLQHPRLEFVEEGRKKLPRLKVVSDRQTFTFDYDQARRPDLERLDAALRAARP